MREREKEREREREREAGSRKENEELFKSGKRAPNKLSYFIHFPKSTLGT